MARTAVVTGGSAGIGLAVAEHLVREGWQVAILAREERRLEEARTLLQAKGGTILALSVDVADAKAVDEAAERIERELGPIEAWINNAMSTVIAPADEISPAEYERVTATTYLSQVYGTLAALRHMKPRRRGAIVQVSSGLAIRAAPLQAAYCGAKFAVSGFTDALRSELLEDDMPVSLSVVYLPAVNTPQSTWSRTHTGHEQIIPDPLFDPRFCAEAIVSAIANPQRELWVGRSVMMMAAAQALAPGLADRKAGSMRKAQLGAPMPDREGNLFEPVAGPARIDGNDIDRVTGLPGEVLTSREHGALRLALSVGLLGAAYVAGALAARARDRWPRRLR